MAEKIARIILNKPAEWMYQEHPELWGEEFAHHKSEITINSAWPFGIPYTDYEALPAGSKVELDKIVVAFIRGALSVKSGAAA